MGGVATIYMAGILVFMGAFFISAFYGMAKAKKREEGKK
jgi:hypothetical protein